MFSAQPVAEIAEESPASAIVRELADDLRQPLSSIAAIAYYVEMTLPAGQLQAQHYMQRLQDLVDQTNSILKNATSLPGV